MMIKAEATVKWEKSVLKIDQCGLRKKSHSAHLHLVLGTKGLGYNNRYIVTVLSAYSMWSSVQIGDAHTGFLYCFA